VGDDKAYVVGFAFEADVLLVTGRNAIEWREA
jgi:hypothetical protein